MQGDGNPDAVGAPVLPALSWAHVSEPDVRSTLVAVKGQPQPRMDKRFIFALTPTQAGRLDVPQFPFAYFDPVEAKFRTTALGPFTIDVLPANEEAAHVVASADIPVAAHKVEILAEDIRPLMERPVHLGRERNGHAPLWALVFGFPVVAYAGMRIFQARRRRFAENAGLARSHRAKSSGLRRLRGVAEAKEPAEALFRAMVAYVSDTLNLGEVGLTSSDVQAALDQRGVHRRLTERTVQILRACERARYGSQRLSNDEVSALISAAESCMNSLDAATRKGKRG